MVDKKVTIFTPTYNRAYILGRLYDSLKRQTCDDFIWIIVDDGSDDNTEELVRDWIDEELVSIYYYKQKNGGKQRAHNKGVEHCDTELFLCIDSDDYLVDNCVEILLNRWMEVRENPKIAGIVAMKGYDDKTPLGTWIPEEISYSSLDELYTKYKFKGDAALAYRTSILKEYPYWVAEGEKFIGEGYVYQKIDQLYCLLVIPQIIAICEYLDDGYSANVRRLTKNNPVSYTELKRQTICYSKTWRERYYHTILCIAGCIMSGRKNPFGILPYKFLGVLAYIPAWMVWVLFYKNA